MKKQKINISDDELEELLCKRLERDPIKYLDFLRRIIDKKPLEISDETLETFFELLKPSQSVEGAPPLSKLFSAGSGIKMPKGVDLLYYPFVRRKLKEWQQIYLDNKRGEQEREKAKKMIRRVFDNLIYIGQGRPKALSQGNKKKIIGEFKKVYKICKDVFAKSKNSGPDSGHWNLLIKENFPDVAEKILAIRHIETPEKLRNCVLAKRYDCTRRKIEELAMRYDMTLDIHSIFSKYPTAKSMTIKGSGGRRKIIPQF